MSVTITYDVISDTLRFDACPPYAEQDSDEIRPGIVARFNPSTGYIENIEVLFFKDRVDAGKTFEIPLDIQMRAAS